LSMVPASQPPQAQRGCEANRPYRYRMNSSAGQ
jgi:hypothetical protein